MYKHVIKNIKRNPIIRRFYFILLYLRNILRARLRLVIIYLTNSKDRRLLSGLAQKVRKVHPENLALENAKQFFIGKNILGYPALSYITKDGVEIGWSENYIARNSLRLPFLQVTTDIEKNIPLLFSTFKPEIIVDFGTASGGSAVFFHELAEKYCDPRVLTIDISDKDVRSAQDFHTAYGTENKIKMLFGKSSLDCVEEVSSFLINRKTGQRVLFSFDNNHSYNHTYKELCVYAPMLQSGDIILMQDTWDQGLYGHETSPMLSVERFISENSENYKLAEDFLTQVDLPCNFIYGVIIKK